MVRKTGRKPAERLIAIYRARKILTPVLATKLS